MAEESLCWYPRDSAGYDHDNTCTGETLIYHNIKDLLARFFLSAHYLYGVNENWRSWCIGVTNYYYGRGDPHFGRFMPIFDYDGRNIKKQIRKDVKLLQEKYELADAWVYSTKKGFHVYFFCNAVSFNSYKEMLNDTGCCKGFKNSSIKRGYSVLRVSAKYTTFDIEPLYILKSSVRHMRRMGPKAHLIMSLINLGRECGTHFASMYPQWSKYYEDPVPWKAGGKAAKPVRKGHYITYHSAPKIGLDRKYPAPKRPRTAIEKRDQQRRLTHLRIAEEKIALRKAEKEVVKREELQAAVKEYRDQSINWNDGKVDLDKSGLDRYEKWANSAEGANEKKADENKAEEWEKKKPMT